MKNRTIKAGIYLVIDPSLNETLLLDKLRIILQEKIAAVQIWDNFPPQKNHLALIRNISSVCHEKDVPVIINNHWEWLQNSDLDGVHFDSLPDSLDEIREKVNRDFVAGLTVNNNLTLVQRADKAGMDYISFCSVFPSATSNSCEPVKFDTIREAKNLTSMPLFLAGGIRPENMHQLKGLSFDGIAVVSGIMSAGMPGEKVKEYLRQLELV